jgi:leader peptidase (prepilin peptidase)/N-methyltransferase
MFVEANPLFLALLFVAGLAAGGLGVTVVHRDRARVALMRGPFLCPECGAPAPRSQRIPLISYLAGKGHRRACGDKIRVRDPMLELGIGVAWVLVGARLGLSWILPAFLAYATTLAILSAVDLDERRIPNKVLGPMSLVAAGLLLVAALVEGKLGVVPRMVVGGLGYAAPMLLLALIAPGSMGMGDIKLAAYIGAHLAWFSLTHVLAAAFAGFIIGALVGLLLIVLRKKGRKDTVPFGPSMAIGGFLPLFLGPSIPAVWKV